MTYPQPQQTRLSMAAERQRRHLFAASAAASYFVFLNLSFGFRVGIILAALLTSPVSFVMLMSRRPWRGLKWALVMMIPVLGAMVGLLRLYVRQFPVIVVAGLLLVYPLAHGQAAEDGGISAPAAACLTTALLWGFLVFAIRRRNPKQLLLMVHAMPMIVIGLFVALVVPFAGAASDVDVDDDDGDIDAHDPAPVTPVFDSTAVVDYAASVDVPETPAVDAYDVDPTGAGAAPATHWPVAAGPSLGRSPLLDLPASDLSLHPIGNDLDAGSTTVIGHVPHKDAGDFNIRVDAVTGDLHAGGAGGGFDARWDPVTGGLHGQGGAGRFEARFDAVTNELHGEGPAGRFDARADAVTGDVHVSGPAGRVDARFDPVTGVIHGEGSAGRFEARVDAVTGDVHVNSIAVPDAP